MAISTTRQWRCSHRENYQISFFDHHIHTIITHTPRHFIRWINHIVHHLPCRRCRCCGKTNLRTPLIVGLDIEWRHRHRWRYPVALLQLCVGEECLIFQLQYAKEIPKCLINFLKSDNFIFVGVGIEDNALKLLQDYDLQVVNAIDLRELASLRLDRHELCHVGLKGLAREVLGVHYKKPKKIALSEWDKPYLSKSQVQYASIDAFLSFSMGEYLFS